MLHGFNRLVRPCAGRGWVTSNNSAGLFTDPALLLVTITSKMVLLFIRWQSPWICVQGLAGPDRPCVLPVVHSGPKLHRSVVGRFDLLIGGTGCRNADSPEGLPIMTDRVGLRVSTGNRVLASS